MARKPARRNPYYFDHERADAAVAFFPTFLRFVDGEWAGRPFQLEDWQAHHVRQIFGWRHRKTGRRRYRFVRLWVPRKNGKGLALDTPLPTPSGWTTMGQVAVGDRLYDEGGLECTVTFVSPINHLDCYEIEFSNGERIVCDGDHRWLTTARIDRPGLGVGGGRVKSRRGETLTKRVRTARELYLTVNAGARRDRNHSLDMPKPIVGRHAALAVDPYVLGVWLGDGSSDSASITCGDRDLEATCCLLRAAGVYVKASRSKTSWRVSIGTQDLLGNRDRKSGRSVQTALRALGVLGNKRIPPEYQRAALDQRLSLLQGLMDTDGHIAPNGKVIELTTTVASLGDDYAELLAGMGIKFSRRVTGLRCNGRVVEGSAHRFQFCVPRDVLEVFRLPRKLERQRLSRGRSRTVQIVSIKPIATVPTRCIQVDSASHLFRCGRTMLPTHNTALAAGLAHLLTIGDEEPGAQVYSHALDGKQAALCYENAARMVALSAQLSKIYTVTKTGMIDEGSMSSFRPLSGEAYGKHGLSPHANIGDEAHAWRNGNLHTFLIQGMGARRQPLDITISTAGEIKTYGHELYLASKAIFENPDLDPETYVSIYEAAPEDDWTDPKVWAKANPNLGVSLKPEFLQAECKRAQQTPRLENDFKRYHLNLWVEQATRWLAMKMWPANTVAPNDKNYWKKLPALMGQRKGKPVFAGLDLGSTSDITALIWIFPPENDSDRVTLVCRFWVPEDRVAERDSVRTPYKKWVADGALLTTPGNVTDYDFIEFKIIEDVALFGLTGMGFDPWNATQVVTHLQEEGLPLVEVRQGFASLNPGSKELERLFQSGRLEHGNHPVLQWMFGNATIRKDPAGNIKPDKERAAEKIDGVAAAVTALGLMQKPIENESSGWNTDDIDALMAKIEAAALAPDQTEEASDGRKIVAGMVGTA